MSKNLKYELTEEFILVVDKKLFRIRALKDFSDVKVGDLGGYIEKESNLSQEGDCWVYGNAWVFDDAKISGDAWVFGNSQVYDKAWVYGEAWIYDNAQVYDNSQIFGVSRIFGGARVSDNVQVSGNSWVFGEAWVYGNAKISFNAMVFGNAKVFGDAQVYGNAKVSGGTWPVSPFYLLLSKHSITSFNYTYIKIGCKILSIDEWKERGEEIGRENGYSDEEIQLYCDALLFAEKYIELVKTEANK